MRALLGLGLPLVAMVVAYIIVFAASQGGGSFMGLLAMPVAAGSLIALLIVGANNVRSTRTLSSATSISMAIAIVPPVLLLVFRALES